MADFNRKVVGIDVDVNTKINKKGIDDLLRQLQALKNLTGQDLINVGTAENLNQANSKLKEIRESAMQIEAALNKSFNFTLGTTDLTKLNNELNKLDWAKIIKDFNNAGAMGKNAFRSVTTEVLTTNLQLKESHKLLKAMSNYG